MLLLTVTDRISSGSCMIDSLSVQPKSCIQIIKSLPGIMVPDLVKQYFNDASLSHLTLFDKKYPLLKYKNEISSDNNQNRLCPVCSLYKTKVIFIPCEHTFCIHCSYKINTCAVCRSIPTSKNIFDKN